MSKDLYSGTLKWVVLGPIAFVVFIGCALAQDFSGGPERILLFHSDITVNADSTVTVCETIKVLSTGNEIRHGIYRDFPTDYRGIMGRRYVVGFHVLRVQKDGRDEPYHIERRANGWRIYIGDADVLIPPGRYTYSIEYKTTRQIGFFEDFDELYWNVTGTGWTFQIDEARAVVKLPGVVPVGSIELGGYTGPMGSRAADLAVGTDEAGRPFFKTTRSLGPREGLTIYVRWPKGFVTKPGWRENAKYFIQDNRGIAVGMVGFIAVLIYYLLTWLAVGVDPEKGVIMPLYTPPAGLSPAAMRYMVRMGADDRTFASALVSMAVKRFVRIEEENGSYKVTRDRGDESSLSVDEQVVSSELLGSRDSISLKDENHQIIAAAREAQKAALKKDYSKYFSRNTGYFVVGALLSAGVVIISVAVDPAASLPIAGFMSIWLTGWTVGVTLLLSQVIKAWRGGRTRGLAEASGKMSAGFLALFSIPFLVGEIVGLWMLAQTTSLLFVGFILLLGIVNSIFYQLLRTFTIPGRRLMDQIEGFRMYLTVAEGDVLKNITPVAEMPELFEKYLPYALALGVEQRWAERFAAVLAMSAASYEPAWYSGSSWSSFDAGGFVSSLGGSLSGAIASASSPPGSSSGGGGGGSSGGGGGGGGGGGW